MCPPVGRMLLMAQNNILRSLSIPLESAIIHSSSSDAGQTREATDRIAKRRKRSNRPTGRSSYRALKNAFLLTTFFLFDSYKNDWWTMGNKICSTVFPSGRCLRIFITAGYQKAVTKL
mmetsp:Transcript_26294/g.52395  ORF Transcript_26294/g.52395 Transcript_26294/m.52395 type:complete len:118 (-) Transcript_26294:357-710(-)